MYHCFISKTSFSGQPDQREQPTAKMSQLHNHLVNAPQVNCEEDDCDQRDDRSVLNFSCSRPRDALHLRAHIAQKLTRAREESSTRSRHTAFTAHASAFRALAKTCGAWAGHACRNVRRTLALRRLLRL